MQIPFFLETLVSECINIRGAGFGPKKKKNNNENNTKTLYAGEGRTMSAVDVVKECQLKSSPMLWRRYRSSGINLFTYSTVD